MKKMLLTACAVVALSACSTGKQKSVEVINTDVTQQPVALPAPKAVKVSKQARKNKRKTPDYAARRVVQIGTEKLNRSYPMNIDVQEGPARGVYNIVSMYGENHTVNISRKYPSIIMTPFADPDIQGNIDQRTINDIISIRGSNIVVWPKNNQGLWFMINDKANPRGIPVSLTLIPKQSVMSRTISVTVGRQSPSEQANGLTPDGNGFAQKLSQVLQDIVTLKVPAGYTVRPLKEKLMLENGMATLPVERYTNREFDVLRYRITNNRNTPQELEEAMFGQNPKIRAVAFYPRTVLYPGESTDVLMLVSKRN
ncbi:TraK domain-containing protein [Neisseria canis]|uniref:Conjugal transfer protein TraK n=1 Tax=Neisseria canis TaxID=493 RepID=A0A1X3D087_9NEIS|nr:type-F conjugative transfer system secretin TraK [Neisseria canis]OSI12947.1 hypothetical protein BWD07_02405 [Neisseria canis]VEF02364.1 conjugal transfer protein TraK [Neisseria canis]